MDQRIILYINLSFSFDYPTYEIASTLRSHFTQKKFTRELIRVNVNSELTRVRTRVNSDLTRASLSELAPAKNCPSKLAEDTTRIICTYDGLCWRFPQNSYPL